jgi:hypothetical protein
VIRGYHAEIDLNALNRGVQAPIAVQVRPLRASEVLGLEVDLLFFDTTSTYFVTEEADAPVARDQHGNQVPDGGRAAAGKAREAGFRT